MHSHNNMAVATLMRLRTAELLQLVTYHPQMAGSNNNFRQRVARIWGSKVDSSRNQCFSFRPGVINS